MNGNMQLGELGEIAYKSWRETTSHFSNVELGPFIVMPNHVHGIVTITDDPGRGTACCAPTADDSASKSFGKLVPGSIPVIVRSYKSAVANQIHKSQPNIHALIWQRNYFEHIITSDEDYARIAAYIEFNSENWLADEENREYS
jgi:REP element-mobilizing transposase RayT